MRFTGARPLLLLFAALAFAPAPAMSPAHAATAEKGTLSVGGSARTYTIYRPARASGRAPILLVLHGGMGNGARVAKQSGFLRYVDREGFIAVFPDAGGNQWNDGRETTRSGQNDVAYLVQLIQKVAAEAGGDPQRVFVAGVSNGGMMAQRMACEAAGSVTAVGVVVANMPSGLAGSCRPARSVPIVFFNATDDPLMPWDGGQIKTVAGKGAGGSVISASKTADFWARVNGCTTGQAQAMSKRANDGTSVVKRDFAGCAGGSTVQYEVQGAGHTWPGSTPSDRPMVRRIVGNTTQDINATQLMVEFFRKYGL